MAKAKVVTSSAGKKKVRLTLSLKEAAAVKIATASVAGNRTTWFKQADAVWEELDSILTCIPVGGAQVTEGWVKALKPIDEAEWK